MISLHRYCYRNSIGVIKTVWFSRYGITLMLEVVQVRQQASGYGLIMEYQVTFI